jgi:putative SOS response-associated peptidase YedK
MCNLYSITKNQAAIRDLFKVARDTTGNLPPLPAIFPDLMAPVVRVNEGERELTMMRWGMPPAAVSGHHDQHPQHWVATLATMACAGEPVPRADVIVLRIRGHQAEKDAEMVCHR